MNRVAPAREACAWATGQARKYRTVAAAISTDRAILFSLKFRFLYSVGVPVFPRKPRTWRGLVANSGCPGLQQQQVVAITQLPRARQQVIIQVIDSMLAHDDNAQAPRGAGLGK